MRELIDCHIHTQRCGHAVGTVDDYVRAAVQRGLAGMAMTEHLPLPADLDPHQNLSMPACDLEEYLVEVDLARQRYPEIDIVTGIEADFLPGREALTARLIDEARERPDGVRFVLGSVHFLGEWAFDDPDAVHVWDERDVDEVWREYFTTWCAAASSGMFQVMAHPDLPKKFGHRPSFDPSGLYRAAAQCAAENGVLIEVSTGGLRKPVAELYPGSDLLSAFCRAGVRATVGSDAHKPEEVGFRIEFAYGALATAGYTGVAFPDGSGGWRTTDL